MTRKLNATQTRDLLRTVRDARGGAIANSFLVVKFAHQLFDGHPVYVTYRRQQPGRWYQSAAWQVIDVTCKTDPDANWRDRGNKTFEVYSREQRAPQLAAALDWAIKYVHRTYGQVAGFTRNAYGDYTSKHAFEAVVRYALDLQTERQT